MASVGSTGAGAMLVADCPPRCAPPVRQPKPSTGASASSSAVDLIRLLNLGATAARRLVAGLALLVALRRILLGVLLGLGVRLLGLLMSFHAVARIGGGRRERKRREHS